jgi:hypothetical protein
MQLLLSSVQLIDLSTYILPTSVATYLACIVILHASRYLYLSIRSINRPISYPGV